MDKAVPLPLVFPAFLSIALWALSYSVTSYVLQSVPAGETAFLRLSLASFFLALVMLVTRQRLPALRHWPSLCALGIIGFAAYILFLSIGQSSIEAGRSSFIIASTPVLVVVLSYFLLGERLDGLRLVGSVVAIAGVWIIVFFRGANFDFADWGGVLLLVAAAFSHALHFVLKKLLLLRIDPVPMTFMSITFGAIALSIYAPSSVTLIVNTDPGVIAGILFLGIFASAVAHLSWTFVIAGMPVSIATNMMTMIPPLATLFSVVYLDEPITMSLLFGGALILLGVFIVQNRRLKRSIART